MDLFGDDVDGEVSRGALRFSWILAKVVGWRRTHVSHKSAALPDKLVAAINPLTWRGLHNVVT